MAYVRVPDVDKIEDEMFRLVFLVPDGVEELEDPDKEQNKRYLLANLDGLLKRSTQAAVMHPKADFPDDDATSILHRGGQPGNKHRVVIHFHRDFVNQVGAPNIYGLDWFTLASSASTVRLVKPDGTEVFIKDRYGWEE